MLYDLALCYERADWTQIDSLAGELHIQTNLLTSLYFSCMEDVNRIWDEITQASASRKEEAEKAETAKEPSAE